MQIQGNNVLVAWNDKYCPSANPFDLVKDEGNAEVPYPEDLYKVNGAQGSVDYGGIDPDGVDNIMNTADDCVDTITGDEADAVKQIVDLGTKPVPAVPFVYPVRITNNEVCSADEATENKLYCHAETEVVIPDTDPVQTEMVALNCIDSVSFETGSQGNSQTVSRCVQADLDYMTPDSTIEPANAVLDGETGASRPALKILATNADDPATLDIDETEYVAILAYEETKGLSESDPGDGVPKNGDDDLVDVTDIALEGKAVYFESFLWDQPVTVSAGRIVNLRAPESVIVQDDATKAITVDGFTGDDIYQNARRVVICGQVDSCDAAVDSGNPTFAIMYKQDYDTQGGPSDMFIHKNYGFTYDDFETVTVDATKEAIVYNVSSHETVFDT